MRRAPHLAAMLAAATLAGRAVAQEYPIGASLDVATGVEGGGKGHAKGVRRARTALHFGGEMALSEQSGPRIGAGLLVELEPRTAVGAVVRYLHLVADRFALHLGAVGILAPSTLFGATAGGELRLAVHRRAALTAGPRLQAFFFGEDLPGGTVIFQGLFHVGIHVSLVK